MRYFSTLFFFALATILISTHAHAQKNFTLIIPEVTDTCNSSVDIPIKVKDFKQMLALQFSVAWDTSKLTYAAIKSIDPSNLQLTINNFGLNNTSNGNLIFAWSDALLVSRTLADSSVLFLLTFNVKKQVLGKTIIKFQSIPTEIEATSVG